MIKQTIAEELRAKQSRDNRELLDRAADYIETLEREYESLTEKFNCQQTVYADLSKIIKDQAEELKTAKAEAYKEVFERLGEKLVYFYIQNVYQISAEDYNTLVKEKTEGPDNAVQT